MKSSRIANSAHRPRSRRATPSSVRKSALASTSVGSSVNSSSNWSKNKQGSRSSACLDQPAEVGRQRRSSASSASLSRRFGAGPPPGHQRAEHVAVRPRPATSGLVADAHGREDVEVAAGQLGAQAGLEQRRLAGARGRVEEHDPLGDEQVAQLVDLLRRARRSLRRRGTNGGRRTGFRRSCLAGRAVGHRVGHPGGLHTVARPAANSSTEPQKMSIDGRRNLAKYCSR